MFQSLSRLLPDGWAKSWSNPAWREAGDGSRAKPWRAGDASPAKLGDAAEGWQASRMKVEEDRRLALFKDSAPGSHVGITFSFGPCSKIAC